MNRLKPLTVVGVSVVSVVGVIVEPKYYHNYHGIIGFLLA